MWDLGEIDEQTLRGELRHMFRSREAVRWWQTVGAEGWQIFRVRGSMQFARIVDEVASEPGAGRKKMNDGTPPETKRSRPLAPFSPPQQTQLTMRLAAVAITAGAGMLVGALVSSKLRNRHHKRLDANPMF